MFNTIGGWFRNGLAWLRISVENPEEDIPTKEDIPTTSEPDGVELARRLAAEAARSRSSLLAVGAILRVRDGKKP